ncbi:MAG: multiple antibiotic resistance (MarC)-related protein [uncultured bacterium]|nr:MAG: multiple antibiotic resistance (MarC)-related protein [uncultured bacterium]
MMTLYSATITLILVMDPLGNIPLFLSILNHIPARKRRWIILRETFFAFIILTLFLFFGPYILAGMGISQPALGIAGGIILFLISLRMIFPHEDHEKTKLAHEPFIVPLAIPLIAGPSTMTVVMLLANQAPYDMPRWFLALTMAWFISAVILFCADFLRKILGERGLIAIERLMGMILTTMAVQMLLTGLEQFLHV